MHIKPLAIGLNCALGAAELREHIVELAKIANCYVSAHPNADYPTNLANMMKPLTICKPFKRMGREWFSQYFRWLLRQHTRTFKSNYRPRWEQTWAYYPTHRSCLQIIGAGSLNHRQYKLIC